MKIACLTGGPPPREVGEAMIVGMGVTVYHRLPHVQKGHGPPALSQLDKIPLPPHPPPLRRPAPAQRRVAPLRSPTGWHVQTCFVRVLTHGGNPPTNHCVDVTRRRPTSPVAQRPSAVFAKPPRPSLRCSGSAAPCGWRTPRSLTHAHGDLLFQNAPNTLSLLQ